MRAYTASTLAGGQVLEAAGCRHRASQAVSVATVSPRFLRLILLVRSSR